MRFSRTLTVVDAHAEGESGKVVVGGVGPVPGSSMFDNNAEADFGYIILESTEYPADQEGSSRTTGRHASARIVSPGRLDRSPCGTGTSARLALLHARGQLRSLPTTNWSLTQPTPSQKDSSLGNRGKLSTDMTNGPITDWSNLAGAHVEIRQQGAAICTGTVDAVTEDGSILWVYAEPYGRRLFEKAEYFEAWAAEERLGFHYRMAMGWTRPVPGQ